MLGRWNVGSEEGREGRKGVCMFDYWGSAGVRMGVVLMGKWGDEWGMHGRGKEIEDVRIACVYVL